MCINIQNLYLMLQNVIQNIDCTSSGPCTVDADCTGNNGADVCVNGKCGM